MSISGDRDLSPIERQEYSYADIEIQQWYLAHSVAAGSLGGGTDELGGQNDVWTGVLGGREPLRGNISRGQVAELVGIEMRAVPFINSTETADGTLQSAVSLSREPTFQLHDGDQINTTNGTLNGINAQTIGSGGNPEKDVLAHCHAVAFGPFSDGGTGVGGGGSSQAAHYELDYIETYGSGPLFDREDEFYHHVSMRQWNIADAAIHLAWYERLYWLVHDVGDIESQIYESPYA